MKTNQSALIGRRGELLAELLLQDLGASSVVKATDDFDYDLLANFENGKGGVNTYAVEVKATENLESKKYPLQTTYLQKIAYSSLPTLLLVADVKMNRMYHAWLTSKENVINSEKKTTLIPVMEINDVFKEKLAKQLRSNVRDMIEIEIPIEEFQGEEAPDTWDRIRRKAIDVGLIAPDEELPEGIDIEIFRGSRYMNLEVRFPSS